MLDRHSALATRLADGVDQAPADARVRMGEVRGFTLRQIAGFPATMRVLMAALENELRAAMPDRIGKVGHASATTIMRVGPEQLWLIGRAGDGLETRARECVSAGTGVITELSHSRTRIFIDGPKSAAVLAKGIALDFDPAVFRPDTVALTGLHHMPLLVHRIDEQRFELYVMRTFALCVWDWLADAALEHRCVTIRKPEPA